MVATPNESDKVQPVRQVSSLTQYVEWVNDIGGQNMLFRGLANAGWKVESSLYRWLRFNGFKDVDSDMFLERNKMLIDHANTEDYIKNRHKLNNLELLAYLQHYGTPTCLIDFTRDPRVALYFACEELDNKTGRVVAFSSDNNSYNKITKDANKDIEHWFKRNKKPWIFPPSKELNDRIPPQQSVFVFGNLTLSDENFSICEIETTKKKGILEELKKYGIFAEMLFDPSNRFYTKSSQNKNENYFPDHDFVSGKLYQAFREFKLAIEFYDRAIKYDSQDSEAHNNCGNCRKGLGDFEGSINDYNNAIYLNPKHGVAYYNRGNAKCKLGRFKDAISDYDDTIGLNPELCEAYINRGNAKGDLGDFKDAIPDYDDAIKLNPESCEAYINRGNAKCKLGRLQDAIRDFDKGIELNLEYLSAYYNRGLTKNNLGKFQDAIRDFDKAIELNPEYLVAYYNRGLIKNNLGKFQDAIRDFDKAIELNPEYLVAYYNRGLAKNNLGKFQDAINDYDKAIELNPKDWMAYHNRGSSKKDLRKFQDAISDFDKSIELNPKDWTAYYNRGVTKIELGDTKCALVDFAKAKELNPELKIPDLPSDNSDK